MVTIRLSTIVFLAVLLSLPVQAQDKLPIIEPLSWSDNKHLETQKEWVNDLAKQKLGQRIRGDQTDLDTLQKIVDRSLIDQNDSLKLQALGVVLGDLFVAELGVEWMIYRDKKGRSRAVCVPKTEECLFPITMLSRRIEVGLKPDVQKVYNDAQALIKPYLPKLPYQVD